MQIADFIKRHGCLMSFRFSFAMRLTLVFALCMGMAARSFSQTVTYKGNRVPLTKLFSVIKQQTGYSFFYNDGDLRATQPVSVDLNNTPLATALQQVLKDQPVEYAIKGKTIVVTAKGDRDSKVVVADAAGNDIVVSGRIMDMDHHPVPGASISVKNTKVGVMADSKGVFSLGNVPENCVLVISAVGFPKTELQVKNGGITSFATEGQNAATEETENNAKALIEIQSGRMVVLHVPKLVNIMPEMVVTGISQRSFNSFTGSAKTISGAELKTVSSNNVFTAITAFEPSFRVIPNNVTGGSLNQLPEVQLRGSNSFPNLTGELSANPNLPLFILDGFEVPLQRIVDLDMNLINSVTLLKDASATAIYGSRGANGVMVVTTIAPKKGKIQVTFTDDIVLTSPQLSVYHLLDAYQKLDFEKRAGVYDASSPFLQYIADNLYNERLKAAESGINTNWLKLPTSNGWGNRASVYLQGGDNAIRYGLQIAANLQNGVMKGQKRNNYSGQFDLAYVVKKVQFKNSIRVYENTANESPYGDFSKYVSMNPYWTPYDSAGNVKQYLEDYTYLSNPRKVTNPMYDASLHSVNKSDYFGFTNNFQIRYTPIQNLFFETNFSITKQDGSADQFYSAQDSRFIDVTDPTQKGSYTARSDKNSSYESLTTANYNLMKGRSKLFNTLAFNFANTSTSYYQVVATGFPFDRMDNILFATQYAANSKPAGDEGTVRRLGLVYSGNYSWDDRYLADVSVRRDGSSQFGTDSRFGTFWATGIGWNIHNEKFFVKKSTVNRLKLRASYGSTGSLNIPAYSAQSRYTFGVNTSYYNELGAALVGLGNDSLQWQNVYKLNVGMDAVLFNEKLDARVDIYKENTMNALTQITLAPSTGFSSYNENLGEVQNTGLEFALRYKILQNNKKGMLWSVNINGFTNKNILKHLSDKLKAANEKLDQNNSDQTTPNILLKEGESINTIYAVRSLGVDPTTGSEIYLGKDGKQTFVWNAADKVASGVSLPKWSGNFGSSFSYMGFDVNLIFNYQYGGQMYNQTLVDRVESVNPVYNVDQRAYNLGWTKPGDVSQYTKITTSKAPTQLTTRFVQNDNQLSLSSASLGYNFYRSSLLKRLKMSSLQVRAITNEVFQATSIQVERGTSNPFARTYSLSIRAGF